MIIEKKYGVTVHLREISTLIDIKIPTTVFVYISYSARALDADVA